MEGHCGFVQVSAKGPRFHMKKRMTAVALVLAGPTAAFVALYLGCLGSNPFFGVWCGHNFYLSFAALTVAVWFVIGPAVAVISWLRSP